MTEARPQTTLADYRQVIALHNSRGEPFVVVGGQAANVWGDFYLEAEPGIAEFMPLTSKDLDVLGDTADLYLIARELGTPPIRSEPGAPSPVVGVVEFVTPSGARTRIEVLYAIYGLDNSDLLDDIAEVLNPELGLKVRLPHPLACLKAKTHNVARLNQERRQDLKHLKVLQLCNRAFLRDVLAQAERGQISERAAVNPFEALFKFTQTRIAREAAAKYNLNWAEAFPVKELLATTLPRVRSFMQKRFIKVFPTCVRTTP